MVPFEGTPSDLRAPRKAPPPKGSTPRKGNGTTGETANQFTNLQGISGDSNVLSETAGIRSTLQHECTCVLNISHLKKSFLSVRDGSTDLCVPGDQSLIPGTQVKPGGREQTVQSCPLTSTDTPFAPCPHPRMH